jgi:protein-tyrosine phosphatase
VRRPVRICFVCSGNICRSPTAAVVLDRLAADAGLADRITVASAGTGSWHVGDDMDERSRQVLTDHGYEVRTHVARQFRAADFGDFDVVVALDAGHRAALLELAGRTPDPESARAKVVLLRQFDPEVPAGVLADVADPYYGGRRGFLEVLEQVERSCAGLLDAIARGGDVAAPVPAQQPESPSR